MKSECQHNPLFNFQIWVFFLILLNVLNMDQCKFYGRLDVNIFNISTIKWKSFTGTFGGHTIFKKKKTGTTVSLRVTV